MIMQSSHKETNFTPQKVSLANPEYDWILNEVANRLALFTVCFVKKITNHYDTEDLILSGSGTLVKTEKHYGILTADHVLQNQDRDEIGLIFPNRFDESPQRHFYCSNKFIKLQIGPASYTAAGPDLGFLILNPIDARDIEKKMCFYNLSQRRDKMQSPRSVDKGGWFLSGGIEEGTTESPPERTFTKIKNFSGICALGAVKTERHSPQFDYLDFELSGNERYEGPKNFEGISGGGLWQIVLENNDNNLRIKEYLLSGVAFFQVEDEDNNPGRIQRIICHGRQSIYDVVISTLNKYSYR